jgi:hypothetical protein
MFEHRPLRGLAHQAAERKQEPEFGNEDRFRIDQSRALGCDRRGRQDENDRGKQKNRRHTAIEAAPEYSPGQTGGLLSFHDHGFRPRESTHDRRLWSRSMPRGQNIELFEFLSRAALAGRKGGEVVLLKRGACRKR